MYRWPTESDCRQGRGIWIKQLTSSTCCETFSPSAGRSDLLDQNSLILMDGADGLDFVFGSEELLFDLESLELPDDSP